MNKVFYKLILASFVTFMIGLFNQAYAQYSGPSQTTVLTNVAEVLKNPVDDQEVVLRGHITKKINKKYYEFKDNTGTIRAEIDNKYFYNSKITDKTLVEISGEVDKDFTRAPEIDVKRLMIINP